MAAIADDGKNPMNRKGTLIIKPGQYRNAYKIGKHKGRTALIQCKPIDVYRDNNCDDNLDMKNVITERGLFAANIHGSIKDGISKKVGKWSAGCVVTQSSEEEKEFQSLYQKSAKKYGIYFTFTLLDEGLFYYINC